MNHVLTISTADVMLICKALQMDMQNDVDNEMAKRLHDKIADGVAYDLKDYRCENCKHFQIYQDRPNKGRCVLKSKICDHMKYKKTRACRKYFEVKDGNN